MMITKDNLNTRNQEVIVTVCGKGQNLCMGAVNFILLIELYERKLSPMVEEKSSAGKEKIYGERKDLRERNALWWKEKLYGGKEKLYWGKKVYKKRKALMRERKALWGKKNPG